MRILQVYRDHFIDLPGGIERHVHDVAQGLSSQHRVEMVASARQKGESRRIGDVLLHVEREYGRPRGIPLAPGIFRRIRDNFDLVHIHSPNPMGEVAWWAARRRVPAIATYHADLDRGSVLVPTYRRFLRRVLADCNRVLCASARLVDSSPVLSHLAERPGLIEVVPFGVDTTRFHPNEGARDSKMREGTDPSPTVLFVGRLRYYKGLPYLIEAVARTDARLLIVGDGLERDQIESLGRERLGPRFTLMSFAEERDLPDIYRSADVFALPSTSREEAFGLATLEAMASGIPVVTTEVGTATSVINEDAVTGLVVPPRDVDALAEAIEKLLGDHQLRARMAAAARARVIERYDHKTMLQRISDIYAEVLTET